MLAARFNRPGSTSSITAPSPSAAKATSGGRLQRGGIARRPAASRPRQAHGLLRQQSHHPRGAADVEFAENVGERFEAYGWHVAEVSNVNALSEIDQAIAAAVAETSRPSLVLGAQPHRLRLAGPGYRQGTASRSARRTSPRPANAGLVNAPRDPGCGLRPLAQPGRRAGATRAAWLQRFERYQADHPDQAAEFERVIAGRLPEGWRDVRPTSRPARASLPASRAARRSMRLARSCRSWSAAPPTCSPRPTVIGGSGDVNRGDWTGRNIHFGIREHAMGAICNGMAAHGGWRPPWRPSSPSATTCWSRSGWPR